MLGRMIPKSHAVEWPKADGTAPIGATGKKLAQPGRKKSVKVHPSGGDCRLPELHAVKDSGAACMPMHAWTGAISSRAVSVEVDDGCGLVSQPVIASLLVHRDPLKSWHAASLIPHCHGPQGCDLSQTPDHNAIVQFCATPPAMRKTRICKLDCLQDTSNPNTMAQHRHSRPAVPSVHSAVESPGSDAAWIATSM
ncbi:conserved hypothetical protein [Coccidioides posadasii str. Silveira]|uniref:Uncharacterized protein n=1 Tax=Coccidioides posadasii (strain RMSCC 757 / Silveira) TaxID=443226 RepID=E9CWJ8_COCPS|nr:conserved hypothetical protein [Coccidioides posadasii str. Silveira]